jgi:HEAT repeat protein
LRHRVGPRASDLDIPGAAVSIPAETAMPEAAAHRVRHQRAARLTAGVLAAAVALLWCGCEKTREPIFNANPTPAKDTSEQQIQKDIAQLAKGKDPKDIDGSAAYDKAVSDLTARGSTIETRIIDALRTSNDWGVRMGCVEVLQSIGGKPCIEHLIASLLDDEALVAFHANKTLEELTKHQEIPAAGKPAGANGLPPVPVRAATNLEMNAEQRLWHDYQHEHRQQLRDAWAAWWKDNQARTRIE